MDKPVSSIQTAQKQGGADRFLPGMSIIDIMRPMRVTTRALHPLFAAELGGIDLCLPISDAQLLGFREAMDHCAVGVIRHAAPFSDAQHVEFTRRRTC